MLLLHMTNRSTTGWGCAVQHVALLSFMCHQLKNKLHESKRMSNGNRNSNRIQLKIHARPKILIRQNTNIFSFFSLQTVGATNAKNNTNTHRKRQRERETDIAIEIGTRTKNNSKSKWSVDEMGNETWHGHRLAPKSNLKYDDLIKIVVRDRK